MIEIIDRKDKKNKKLILFPEKRGSRKFALKYNGDIDGDVYQMVEGKIFRFPLYFPLYSEK